MGTAKCSFCGAGDAVFVELSLYVCNADECNRELDSELRAREERARDDAEADHFSRYY